MTQVTDVGDLGDHQPRGQRGCRRSHGQRCLRNTQGQSYDGWRLTYHGYDFLALRALAARGTITAVGRRLGVGKESDVHYAQGPDGELVALKLHRLGRISFRAIKEKRDYLRHRVHASWMYMAKLAAAKEFAYMKALKDEGFPVPSPIDQNRHVVVMSFVHATPLFQIRSLQHPHQVLERLMRLVVRLLRAGIVHGDFNEFNLMLDQDEKITLIDFPQIEFFDRDVRSIVEFFRKRMNIEVQEFPIFAEALEDPNETTNALKVPDFKDDALLVAAHEQSRQRGDEPPEEPTSLSRWCLYGVFLAQEQPLVQDDEDEDEVPAEEAGKEPFQPPPRTEDTEGFQGLLNEGGREALKEDCEEADETRPEPRAEAEEAEGSGSEAAPGQLNVNTGGRRVRKRQTAKEARANLQKQQKKKPAKANNQKCKDWWLYAAVMP
eukprot:g8557.t1